MLGAAQIFNLHPTGACAVSFNVIKTCNEERGRKGRGEREGKASEGKGREGKAKQRKMRQGKPSKGETVVPVLSMFFGGRITNKGSSAGRGCSRTRRALFDHIFKLISVYLIYFSIHQRLLAVNRKSKTEN